MAAYSTCEASYFEHAQAPKIEGNTYSEMYR